MAIKVSSGLDITGPAPVDVKFVLSKSQMKNFDEDFMPSNYFAVCTDDGKFYTYDKNATPSAETGKFSVIDAEVPSMTREDIERILT